VQRNATQRSAKRGMAYLSLRLRHDYEEGGDFESLERQNRRPNGGRSRVDGYRGWDVDVDVDVDVGPRKRDIVP